MAKTTQIFSTAFLMLFLFLFAAMPLRAEDEGIVRSIKIQGNKRVEDATILYYIKTQVGKPLSKKQIRGDIEQIFSLSQFKDIRVETNRVENGYEVVYILEEIPSVGEIKIVGNQEIESKEILDKIGIKRGATFSEHLIQQSREEITRIYRDKGFFFIEANIETQANKENQVDTVIRVSEGQKVTIENIRFAGNKNFSDKKLREAMETKEKSWISWLDDSGIYKKDALKIDLLRVESFYHDNGHLKVRVLEPQIDINKKDKKINVNIPIEEGEQYRVGKIEIQEDETFTGQELRTAVKIREGEIYNMSLVREDILNLTELYSKKGYAYADVFPVTKINDTARTVDLSIKASKGQKVYIGQINITGNTRTQDNVIRREFRLKEGDLFDSDKLKRSKQRINNLTFFEDVKVDTKQGKQPDLIDVQTSVTERPTGVFTVGAGFSSVENLIFSSSISQDNIMGHGQKLIFSTELSSRRTNFNLSFTEPHLFDSDILAGVDLFNRQTNFFSFHSESKGSGIRLGKSLTEYDWVGLNYRFENVTLSDVAPENETPFLKNGERTTSRIGPTYIRDTRDDFLNPTKGWRHVAKFELAGLGGAKFFRSGYETTYYHPLVGKLIGAVHGEINFADGYSNETLPIFEHYFMGGPNSLRGFTIRDIGPRTTSGDPLGGDKSLLLNVEAQYPVSKSLRTYVFYDRGNVYGAGTDSFKTTSSFDLAEMRHSIGAGLRFISPFGPIGVSYGVKLDKAEGEKSGEFHFSAGGAF